MRAILNRAPAARAPKLVAQFARRLVLFARGDNLPRPLKARFPLLIQKNRIEITVKYDDQQCCKFNYLLHQLNFFAITHSAATFERIYSR
jgi:hypothetical protein